jgi:hypothetical protein
LGNPRLPRARFELAIHGPLNRRASYKVVKGESSSILIPVRIGSQSRVFAVSPRGKMRLLDDRLIRSCLVSGPSRIMVILYNPGGVRAYHMHTMGSSWVPTAPKQASGSSSIEVQNLSATRFVSHLPKVTLRNFPLKRWFPEETMVSNYSINGESVTISLEQRPAVEGINSFTIGGQLARPLSFLDGYAVMEITLTDYFCFRRRLRVYHDGYSEARLGIQHSARFNGVICITCDGVRKRFLYRSNRTGIQTATWYNSNPGDLYSLANPSYDDQTRLLAGEMRPDFVLGVEPLRKLEWAMLEHGNAYDHGTIGAEIAHSVATKMLMTKELRILEPAMRGPDLVSRDRRVAVEARMLASAKPKTASYLKLEAAPHMKQMIRRLRWGLSQNAFKRGVAILSIRLDRRKIIALIKEA